MFEQGVVTKLSRGLVRSILHSRETFPDTLIQRPKQVGCPREVNAKVNGEWGAQLTGLQGKELGALMKRFKESFDSPQALRAFVLAKTPAELELRVRQELSRPN